MLAVLELTAGGVDHAFEAIGLKATAEQAFDMLGRGGTATVIGMVPIGQSLEIEAFQLLMEKRLQGSNMGSNRFRVDMPQYVEWYLAGKLKLDELVSATHAARRRSTRASRRLKAGEVARQLIVVRLTQRAPANSGAGGRASPCRGAETTRSNVGTSHRGPHAESGALYGGGEERPTDAAPGPVPRMHSTGPNGRDDPGR